MERLFTVEEASQMLRVHPDTVRDWLRLKRLGGTKVGRAWRIPEKELVAFTSLAGDADSQKGGESSDQ